jgi:hypothetical protein
MPAFFFMSGSIIQCKIIIFPPLKVTSDFVITVSSHEKEFSLLCGIRIDFFLFVPVVPVLLKANRKNY